MNRVLTTVMLHHHCPPGGVDSHFDWLLENPDDPDGPLIAWRVAEPNWRWPAAGTIELLRIADHRRAYLEYEGPLSDGRGEVRRVDRGRATARMWNGLQGEFDLRMERFSGRVRLEASPPCRWTLRVEPLDQPPSLGR